jgi:preprotein translocase SecE subunit
MKSNPMAGRPAASRAGATGNRPAPAGNRPAPATQRRNVQQTRAFVDGIISEMKRVTWPSREEWVGATLLTIALVVLVGVFTSACDWIFANLFTLVTGTAH